MDAGKSSIKGPTGNSWFRLVHAFYWKGRKETHQKRTHILDLLQKGTDSPMREDPSGITSKGPTIGDFRLYLNYELGGHSTLKVKLPLMPPHPTPLNQWPDKDWTNTLPLSYIPSPS